MTSVAAVDDALFLFAAQSRFAIDRAINRIDFAFAVFLRFRTIPAENRTQI
jgi:hypothetical protein